MPKNNRVYIDFKGQQMTLSEISDAYSIPWTTLKQRHNAGLKDDNLIEIGCRTSIQLFGVKTTLAKISKETGIPRPTLAGRYQSGLRDAELIKSSDTRIDFQGEKITFTNLSKKTSLSASTLRQRYDRGYRDNELVTPGKKNAITVNNTKTTLKKLSLERNIPETTLAHRIRKGLSSEDLFKKKRLNTGRVGEESTNNFVTNDIATMIKKQLNGGAMSQRAIAKHHSVSEATISAIRHNNRWQHIKPYINLPTK
jgi:hypothetical protein